MSNMRITGMVSGMDTELMIKKMMSAESMRVDKVKQDRQWIQWQQEAYRNIIKQTRDMQSKFLDTLKPTSNMRSATSFSKFNYSVTSGGSASSAVNVTMSSSSSTRNVEINVINQLATRDTFVGDGANVRGIKTNDLAAIKSQLTTEDFEFNLTIGSVAKAIKISNADVQSASDINAFAALINTEVMGAFGAEFSGVVTADGSGHLKFDMPGVQVRLSQFGENTQTMTALGIDSGVTNLSFRTQSIQSVFGWTAGDIADFQINGKQVNLELTDTFNQMLDKINASGAGVTLSYDALSDRFTMRSNNEGSSNNMDLSHPGSSIVIGDLFGVGTRNLGRNAELSINGQHIIQTSNTFSFDGINYTLNATHGVDALGNLTGAPPIQVSATVNVDSVVENIKGFIEEYNKLLQSITSQRTERRFYDFKPLTDEQRKDMSEIDIKLWEEKAKSGTLSNARELDSFTSQMRLALIESVEGVGLSLSDIGIGTTSYMDRGVLSIDETKLRAQLDSNFDNVVKLFTQESTVRYGSPGASQRYKESGLAHRLDDIFRDFTRTARDENGKKGSLVERAGIESDASQTQNELTRRINSFDTRLTQLERFLASRENYYYSMFSRMESALSQMNSQAGQLMSMFGMGGN